MEAPKISQKEYLKRYLSKNKDKKKRKKKLDVGPKKVEIIDDDIDLNKLTSFIDEEISILNTTEDAPQIVGVIDERGPVDFDNKQRWKIIADDGTGDIAISKIENPKKKIEVTEVPNLSPPRHKKKKDSGKHRDSDSDTSPPRQRKKNEASYHSSKRHKGSDSDPSPPRQKKGDKISSNGSRRQKDSDSDASPPRQKRKSEASHHSSKRCRGSDSDMSPPRQRKEGKIASNGSRRQRDSDSDISPPRQKKESKISSNGSRRHRDSDSDMSPPRQKKGSKISSNGSRRHRVSDSDTSPPRQKRRSEMSLDINKSNSNPKLNPSSSKNKKHNNGSRRSDSDSDLSPPRNQKSKNKSRKSDSDSDLSPPRNQRDKNKSRSYDSDLRLPRNEKLNKYGSKSNRYDADRSSSKSSIKSNSIHTSQRSRSHWDEGRSTSPSLEESRDKNKKKKTLDGTSAGLQNLKSLKEEEEAQKKREAEMMRKMSKEVSGYGQSTVVRDRKTGRRRNLEQEAAENLEKQKIQDEIDSKYAKWGKGLKQGEDREEKLKRDLHEMSKPLARYANDEDLERELREHERELDPMLDYIREKKVREGKIQPDKPKYVGAIIPNRFGIRPGYRWDGVDRSNGYEKKWFEAQNSKKALEDEAYKWSIADM